MSTQDRLAYEEELLNIMHVAFEQNSEEKEQKYFLQNMVNFDSRGVQINLNFSDPLLISQGQEADTLVIKLLKSYFLRIDPVLAMMQGRSLATIQEDEEYLIIKADLPRQFKSEQDRADMESAAETVETILTSSLILSFIVNLLLNGVMSQLWNIFNTLQIILLLPRLAVLMPANVELVSKVVQQIVNFSPVDKVWVQEQIIAPVFSFDLE